MYPELESYAMVSSSWMFVMAVVGVQVSYLMPPLECTGTVVVRCGCTIPAPHLAAPAGGHLHVQTGARS